MSNFYAPTRRVGSGDEFKEACWIDGYYGPRHFGVRFRGTVDILDGDDYEVQGVKSEDRD